MARIFDIQRKSNLALRRRERLLLGHRVLSSLRLCPDQRAQDQYSAGFGTDPPGRGGMHGGLAVAGPDPPDLWRSLLRIRATRDRGRLHKKGLMPHVHSIIDSRALC